MPDLDHNPRGRQAVIVSSVFTALAFVIVALRLYARFFLVRSPGIEDYGIILAMVSFHPPGGQTKTYTYAFEDMFGWSDDLYRIP